MNNNRDINNQDPLAVLHGDEVPVAPDPAFAARLRARLESALTLPANAEGVVMSGTDTAIAELPEAIDPVDDWDAELDRIVAEAVLARLPEHHRTVLALRYLDDCSVPECAALIGRTVHATETLLVRARRAFRSQYPSPEGGPS